MMVSASENRNDLYCVGWGVKLYSLTHLNDGLALAVNFITSQAKRNADTNSTYFAHIAASRGYAK